MDPVSIKLVFTLFDCFGAMLYELLILGLIDPFYQLNAYESFEEVLVNGKNGNYFRGTEEKRPNFGGNKHTFGEQ